MIYRPETLERIQAMQEEVREGVVVPFWEGFQEREATIQERFRMFHMEHPQVYERLVEMTRNLRSRGYRRVGLKMLFEVLRWEAMLDTERGEREKFKLNNVFTSRYARLIMSEHPDLGPESPDGPAFELRTLLTD